ncbi:ATP-binding protein [Ramlibacter cellulosilyticus]|nr:adenylate/guanylate cyclase domain-containing protein [Ramlibacter cellulosilyticus]
MIPPYQQGVMVHAAQSDLSGTREERRYLTLLFADLSHSTALAERMEQEHYAALIADVHAIYQDVIERHGGEVEQVQGDGVLASFGLAGRAEDAGRRAVQAALEMHERVRCLATPLPDGLAPSLHSGVHSGLVLVREGRAILGKRELLGPVTNTAARLAAAAGPHEILVSEAALGPARRFFVTSPPQQLEVRGRSDPVLVYKVDARAGSSEAVKAAWRAGTEFLGRAAELARLDAALDEAMAGHARTVAIVAPPGQGKTRLVDQFLAGALQRGCFVLRGYCEGTLGGEPSEPFRHMLQALGAEAASATAFEQVLEPVAREQPVVLSIDDWQWADDASRSLLASLRTRRGWPLLVVLCARPVQDATGPMPADDVFPLPPLSADESRQLVATRVPGADPFIAAKICDAAGGNPLFLEELCHSAARGQAERRPGGANAGWLSQLVQSRAEGLDAAQKELVQVAAVIGNVVPAWLLETLTGRRIDDAVLGQLVERDFLFAGERAGTLRFKHGVTRDILYDSVGLHARQALHLRIAEALRQHTSGESRDDALEAMALHYDLGGDAARAADCAEQAADKALSLSALDRARALYRLALASLDKLPQTPESALRWVGIVQRLGRVCVFDPVRSELALGQRAIALAQEHGDASTVGRVHHWIGYMCYSLGDTRAAIRHGELALSAARATGDAKLEPFAVALLGEAYCAAALYDRALPLLDEAIVVKRRHHKGRTNVGLAFSLVCRAYLLAERGDFDGAYGCFDEAAACIEDVTHEVGATVEGWRSAVLLWQGRWQEARDAAAASWRVAERTQSLAQMSIARAMGAYAEWMLEGRPDSIGTIVEVLDWLRPRDSCLYRSLYHGWLADGLLAMGRREEGRAHALQALRRGRERDLLGLPMACRALALDAVVHAPGRAERYLRWGMRAAQQRGSVHEIAGMQLCAARVALRAGEEARALGLLDEAAAAFSRLRMEWHLAQAEALRGEVTRGR